MTDNGSGQRAKGPRECERLPQQKENPFCAPTQRSDFLSLCPLSWLKKEKFLSLHKRPPANAAVKCKMHGRMRAAAGGGEAAQMLRQPLPPVVPARLQDAKEHFLSLSIQTLFHQDEVITRKASSRQIKKSESDALLHRWEEGFSPLFPIITKSLTKPPFP